MPKDIKGKAKATLPPGSNWMALKSTLPKAAHPPSKRRRISTRAPEPAAEVADPSTSAPVHPPPQLLRAKKGSDTDVAYLRSMILGHTLPTPSSSKAHVVSDATIGKYIALDCEMVGVGPATTDERTGKIITESTLARVSLVNYHGETVLDAFVRQKERVTDYRTHVSGVRAEDLVGPNALTLEDVQKKVADILKGRILIGHAVFNDLKALLLKHSSYETKDTQKNAAIRAAYKTNRPGLRTIIKKEFDLDIQEGEHSSVIDARATMALYRLYKNRSVKHAAKSDAKDAMSEDEKEPATTSAPLPTSRSRVADMPFTESKAADSDAFPDSDNDAPSNDGDEEQHNTRSSAIKGGVKSKPILSDVSPHSKKRKRGTNDDDPSLLLHVVSADSPQTHLQPTPIPPIPSPKAHAPSKTKKGPRHGVSSSKTRSEFPGGGRKGVSSGLSTVVRAHGKNVKITGKRAPDGGSSRGAGGHGGAGSGDWWKKL